MGLWLFFGCAVMEPCWKGADSSAAPPRARGSHAVCLLSPQVPGAEDQTALSLEECLRLLEATFPFGDNSEVSPQGPSRGSPCLPRWDFGASRASPAAADWVWLLQEAPGILRNRLGRGGCD